MAEKKQKGLGRGLDSIFGSNVEQFLDDIQSSAKEVPGRREVEIAIEELDQILISQEKNLIKLR